MIYSSRSDNRNFDSIQGQGNRPYHPPDRLRYLLVHHRGSYIEFHHFLHKISPYWGKNSRKFGFEFRRYERQDLSQSQKISQIYFTDLRESDPEKYINNTITKGEKIYIYDTEYRSFSNPYTFYFDKNTEIVFTFPKSTFLSN